MSLSVIATFKPQYEEGKHIHTYPEERWVNLDVTHRILTYPLEVFPYLEDHSENTDGLVDGMVEHSGPFEVSVVDSILEYFGVEDLEDVTQEMIDAKKVEFRKAMAPKKVLLKRTLVESVVVEVNASSDALAIEMAETLAKCGKFDGWEALDTPVSVKGEMA